MPRRGAPAGNGTALACAAAIAALTLAATAAAQELGGVSDTKRLDQLEKTLAEEQARAARLKQREAALSAELTDLQTKLVAAAGAAQKAEQELADQGRGLAALEGEEQAKTAALAEDRVQTGLTLAALERLALRPPDALIAAPGTPLDTVRGALLLKSALPALGQRSAKLRADLEQLANLRREISQSRDALDRAAVERASAAAEIASLIDAKSVLLAGTQAERKRAAERAAALAAEAKDVRDLIAKLSADEHAGDGRPAAGAGSAAEATAPLDNQAATKFLTVPSVPEPPPGAPSEVAALGGQGLPFVERPNLVRSFPTEPASLLMPARGKILRQFDQTAAAGPLSKGIVIQTLPGAQVVAPFDGHVVFEGPFRGYGSILIIEHSDGYHTLLSGLGRIDATVGQWLIAGEPVGVMADQGTPELYVELRRASQPIDPLPWLQIGGDKVKG